MNKEKYYNRIVTFDVDDTLTKREQMTVNHLPDLPPDIRDVVHNTAYAFAMNKIYGTGITREDLKGSDTVVRVIRETMLSQGIEERLILEDLDGCMEEMLLFYQEHIPYARIDALPGAEELLERLSDLGIPMGLVTGNMESIARLKMRLVGFDRYFSFGGYGNESDNRGNLIGIALGKAREKYSLDREFIAYHLGDSPYDITGPRGHGFKSISVATGSYPLEQLKSNNPNHLLPDLVDTERIVQIIMSGE